MKSMELSRPALRNSGESRRRQADRRQAAENALLAAAVRLIATKGVTGTTLAEIGEAAGFSKGLPGHYFKTKNRLLQSVVEYLFDLFAERLVAGRSAERGLDSLIKAVEIYFAPINVTLVKSFVLLQKEALMKDSGLRDIIQQYNRRTIDRLAKEIQIGIGNNEIRTEVDPHLQATLLLGALRGVNAQWAMNRKAVGRDQVRDEMIASIRSALSKGATKAPRTPSGKSRR
jgi:AcrR family transcriptional regulator